MMGSEVDMGDKLEVKKLSPEEEEEERQTFLSVIETFKAYR